MRPNKDPNLGDAYTFVAIEQHTKLVLNIAMGTRDQGTTDMFIDGLQANRWRLPGHDGWLRPVPTANPNTLEDRRDFAVLIKVYAAATGEEHRYSPPTVSATEVVPVMGRPDPERICTSIIERSNLSIRMSIRRFAGRKNAFSKKWEDHWAAVVLWYTYYNFCRVYRSLRMTPAMAAGITGRIWSVRDLLEAA